MPIRTSTPIIQNGNTYPYLSINLAISPLVEDHIGGSIALKLTPYRELEEGGFEFLEDQAKNVVYLDVFKTIQEGDTHLQTAVYNIMNTLQQFIYDKNL
jgi:hypothetical protein